MRNFSLSSLNLKKLSKREIYEICKLKNSFWRYGLKNNLEWFKKNVFKDDLHIILKLNKKIIGYNLLRKRCFYHSTQKKIYYYFDTLIIDKDFRKLNLSKKLLELTNEILKKKKTHGFLICKRRSEKFYKKFNWKKIENSQFIIKDHNYKKSFFIGMINNYLRLDIKKKNIYYFNRITK